MEHKIKSNFCGWTAGKVKGFYGKDYLSTGNGGVKLVKVASFSKYPAHKHPEKTEYAYVINGKPEFTVDDIRYTSEAGDFFIFPSNTNHAIENNTDEECLLLIGAIKT